MLKESDRCFMTALLLRRPPSVLEKQEILIRLVKSGVLATAFRARTEGHATHILKKADVDELIDRLSDGVPQVGVVPRSLMSLRRISATSMQQPEIIRLVLAGKLSPAARLAGAPPLSGLYFHYDDPRLQLTLSRPPHRSPAAGGHAPLDALTTSTRAVFRLSQCCALFDPIESANYVM
jgi:hypothetical protein